MIRRIFLCLITLMLCIGSASAQSNSKIRALQKKRGDLQKEIKQSESLLLSTKKDVKTQMNNLGVLNGQITEQKRLITGIEGDIKVLEGEITLLLQQLKNLQAELDDKKLKYEKSMKYMSRNKTIQNQLLFVLSADKISQMFSRMRYVREYASYQRAQGEEIQTKQQQVEKKRSDLDTAKVAKQGLLVTQQQERAKLEAQQRQKQKIVDGLQKKQKDLTKEVANKRKQSSKLDAQIDKLIEQEIAAAKKRAEAEARRKAEAKRKAEAEARKRAEAEAKKRGETLPKAPKETKKSEPIVYENTADIKLNGSFESNRGRLPVPITGPYVIGGRFGTYAVDGLKNVQLDNKGTTYVGRSGAKARSIFNGEVTAIFQFGGLQNVMVRHGSYISVYCNLSSVSVRKGQKVSTRDILGSVASDGNGNCTLQFQLRRETTKLNPEHWIGR